MKFHNLSEVRKEIRKAVIARVRMIFVFYARLLQFLVQRGRSFFEAVVVVLAAIEIDRHLSQGGGISLRQNKWTVLIPVGNVDRLAEHRAEHARQRRSGPRYEVEGLRRFGDERGTLRARRREQFRMRERETQGPVAAHGNSADGAARAAGPDPVFAFNVRQEFLQKKVVVAYRALGGVDVEAAPALRRDDEKVAHLVLVAQIVEQRPSTAIEECLLVVAQAVQKIEHRITRWGMLRRARIVARGHVDAIADHLFEDVAVESAAVDAALRGRRGSSDQEEQDEPEGADHAGQFTRSAAPGRDRAWPRAQRDRVRKPG